MKYIRMILVAAVSVVLFSAFTMKGGDKPVYVFGVGASFKDSVVYFTEVQLVDSVALDKNGFLPEREKATLVVLLIPFLYRSYRSRPFSHFAVWPKRGSVGSQAYQGAYSRPSKTGPQLASLL